MWRRGWWLLARRGRSDCEMTSLRFLEDKRELQFHKEGIETQCVLGNAVYAGSDRKASDIWMIWMRAILRASDFRIIRIGMSESNIRK